MPQPTCYDYPRPAVTVDCVLFALGQEQLEVLLIRRKQPPFAGCWAIPGGFLDLDEPAEAGARRELREETGVETPWPLDPIGFFDAPGRDPRGRTISLAFASVVRPPAPAPRGSDDAAEAAWVGVPGLHGLAFDHDRILQAALAWLDVRLEQGHVGLALLPKEFTREDARRLFKAVKGSPRPAAGWRRRLEASGLIEPDPTDSSRFRSNDRLSR